jgi:bifunctional non-homologous end joining protein LigD
MIIAVAASEYTPQLATLVDRAPEGDDWVHEIKYDGYRIGCRIRRGRVALYSRNGNEWTPKFADVARAAGALELDDALMDGEVAMVLADGRTSFQALQNLASAAPGSIVYFVFDLLRLNGERFDAMPLEDRKARLRALLGPRRSKGTIRYSEHVVGNGAEFFEQACRLGLEGIISKRRTGPHHPGRHADWQKTKCVLEQEFVIGGFTDPEGARAGLGALLIGFYDANKRLIFSGKVGTGFTQKSALALRAQLERLERRDPPFVVPPAGAEARRAHWVKPELVAEVRFTEWTDEGKIRHPSFQGLREDKKPGEVRREAPRRRAKRRGVGR